ncbi:neutral zinc metallopeptidase [Kribbella sp. NBC_01505]|uniref:neutral zinc metallopeptidase n=1 Tax=Kribbella sp. NBC_01505 TaxID=2903580 RepID=UPI00386CE5C8
MRIVAACLSIAVLAVGCAKESPPPDDAAVEAARARSALPTTTPSNVPGTPVPAISEPPALVKNAIYGAGKLAPSGCADPAGELTALAEVRAYYLKLVACLNKAWAPPVRKAGFAFKAPQLVVTVGHSPDSTCDAPDGQLYYCRGTIYMDARVDIDYDKEDRAANRALMVFFIAHEYAHHIQALTGIQKVKDARDETLNGVDIQLQETRRIELQADCFSGAFAASVRKTFPIDDAWVETWSATYDDFSPMDDTHGLGATRRIWSLKGFTVGDLRACNTFAAAPGELR